MCRELGTGIDPCGWSNRVRMSRGGSREYSTQICLSSISEINSLCIELRTPYSVWSTEVNSGVPELSQSHATVAHSATLRSHPTNAQCSGAVSHPWNSFRIHRQCHKNVMAQAKMRGGSASKVPFHGGGITFCPNPATLSSHMKKKKRITRGGPS